MTELFFENFAEQDDAGHSGRGGVIRDGRGRAMLIPKGVPAKSGVRVPYSSASGLADHIADPNFFHTWELRYLAKGLGQRPDLARLAASEVYSTGLYARFERGEKQASGRRLDSIIERALDHAQIHEKADYGSAFHQHTEPGAPRPAEGDPEMTRDVESFEDTLRRECIKIIETEVFTANDVTMSAGTYDHGVRVLGHPTLDGYVIADKKTGRVDPLHWAVQIASYANGEIYGRENDMRQDISNEINLEWGLVIHTGALTGKTTLYPVDLTLGWEVAQAAAVARDAKDNRAIVGTYRSASFEARLAACRSKSDARLLWQSTEDVEKRRLAQLRATELP